MTTKNLESVFPIALGKIDRLVLTSWYMNVKPQ